MNNRHHPSCITIILIAITICSCSSTNFEKITLKDWLVENEQIQEFTNFSNRDVVDCNVFEKEVLKSFKFEEFKSHYYLDLARCFLEKGDLEKAKDYVLQSFRYGRNISWIDKDEFKEIYPELVSSYPDIEDKFWQKKDTSYFSEIERMVYLDQSSIKTLIADRTVKNREKELEIHRDNSKYLLEYSKVNGFPWSPGPVYFDKNRFRTTISPDILAVHAPIEDKIIIREYAVKSAESGNNSWTVPVAIGVTFFTQIPRHEVKPIRFLSFDKNNELKLEESYLQLYSIQKYLKDNNITNFKIQPSKSNPLDKAVAQLQLNTVKTILVKEFFLNESSIKISTEPNIDEKEVGNNGIYNYVLVDI